MSSDRTPRKTYSEAEAALALRRAASLQLEAAERAERQSVLGRSPDGEDGYAHDDVLEAAREVGIDAAFVKVALAELGPSEALARFDPDTDRSATRWLGTRARSVSVSRRFSSSAAELWPLLVHACEDPAFGLRFDGTDGGHPLEGGVVRFHMMRLGEMATQRGVYTQLCYRMEQLEISDLRVVLQKVVLRSEGEVTDVTIFADLRAGVGRNLRWARVTTAILGALVGAGALAASLALGPMLAAATTLVGSASGAGLSLAGWRWGYRGAAEHLRIELERVLDALARSLNRAALMLPATPATPGPAAAAAGDEGATLHVLLPPA